MQQHYLTCFCMAWVSECSSAHITFASASCATSHLCKSIPPLRCRIASLEYLIICMCRMKAPSILYDKQCALMRAADEAQAAAAAGDSKKLYTIVKRLSGAPARCLPSISSESGEVLTSKQDIIDRWRSHFANLFKARTCNSVSECVPCPTKVSSVHPESGTMLLPLPLPVMILFQVLSMLIQFNK